MKKISVQGQLLASLLLLFFSLNVYSATDIAAEIGSKKISLKDFNRRYEQNVKLSAKGNEPQKEEVLENLVNFELAVAEARQKKIDSESLLKEQFDILLYQELIRREIQPKIKEIKVAPRAIKKFYNKNPLLRTKHIILLTHPEMKADELVKLQSKAQKMAQDLKKNPKKFDDYVKQYSEGPSAKTGGDIDWAGRHKLVPEYYDAALALKKVGRISDVVMTPYGAHIIKLTGIKKYSDKMDPNYKAYIEKTLKEQQGRKVYDAYFSGLKKKHRVKINKKAIL